MLDRWLVNLVIMFVLRQLAKFGRDTDWAKVKADVGARVRDLVPGSWFDDDAVALTNSVIDACAKALGANDVLEAILAALAAGKWDDALAGLRALLGRIFNPFPGTKPEQRLVEDLAAAAEPVA